MGCNCSHKDSACSTEQKKNKYLPAYVSLAMLLTGIVLNHFQWFVLPGSALIWYIIAYIPVGLPVWREAIEGLRRKEFFNEFTLMGIATVGAFCIGEYPEGVAVMLFYSIGEAFQERAVGNARKSIKALLDVRPETATIVHDGQLEIVHPEKVRVGETIEVKTGERIPLDGTLLTEQASFNTAALTGESRPRHIRQGETVLAGMIASDRVVRITVSKPYGESALARILALVQEANERKAPAELFIRRFARVYTPIVTGLAVLLVLIPFLYGLAVPAFHFVFSDWLYRALVFLVISCPCALVVSIPLGYFGGIGAASRAGILFKGGNYLDAITKINTVLFDKTGTLTRGVFEVQKIESTGLPEKTLMEYIAGAESQSTHPVARAICEYAQKRNICPASVTNAKEIPGYGLHVKINGQEVLIGSPRLLSRESITYPAVLNDSVDTIVVCAVNGLYEGYLLLSDTLKEDAPETIEALKALNINNIELLSGDKQAIVTNLGVRLGMSGAYGDLLPEGKVARIETLKKDSENRIAFVGDGINDAPVMAASHIGIAMGGLGSDAAIETADVVIQNDEPSRVATAIRIGRATRRVVWENITLAFAVKFAVLLLGSFGLATLWEAVFADVGVALLAILNALRIQKKRF